MIVCKGEPPLFHSRTALPSCVADDAGAYIIRQPRDDDEIVIDFPVWEAGKSIDNSVFHQSPRFAEKQSNVPAKNVPKKRTRNK